MPNKLILLLSIFSLFTLTTSTQEKITEYKEPEVLEGSNLSIYAVPFLSLTNDLVDVDDSKLRYYVQLSSDFNKWRFTDKLNYAVIAGLNTSLEKRSNPIDGEFYSNGRLDYQAGTSYYFLKNKFFAGIFSYGQAYFSRDSKPDFYAKFYPYVGYGIIKDAFIVNETSNFEKVLIEEKYINRSFDKKTRLLLNSILDKRNGNVYSSKYKDDAEIEFFTELEKFLLNEKVISTPLNARTTMKLYQTLYNRNFVLFPMYKGFQFQAELGFRADRPEDTSLYPKTLTISGVYGLPLNLKTSLLFSAQFVIPLNKNFNQDFTTTDFHSPIFLKSAFQKISNYDYIDDGYIQISGHLYDFKGDGNLKIFHYINNTTGLTGSIGIVYGNRKAPENRLDYTATATAGLVLNIINKLRLNSEISFRYEDNKKYYFRVFNSISYYIF